MRQHKAFLPVILFLLGAFSLDACNFSVELLTTETPVPPNSTPFTPTAAQTETAVPITPTASVTPTLISIRADTLSMAQIYTSVNGGELTRSLAFAPDNTVLATAGGNDKDFAIRLWDVTNGQVIGSLDGHTGIIWDVTFSPDGQLLASVSSDKTAKIWDWRNRTLLKSLDFPGEVVSARFSPDGQTLAIGGVDEPQGEIKNAAVWTFSVGSWKPHLKLNEYIDIAALAYSPDGRWLVGGGTSRNVQVWRMSDGTSVFTLNHSHQVSKLAISPDGSTVATATCKTILNFECMDGAIWLWNLPTGKLIQKITGFPNAVESVAFSADGSSLLAASRDGTLRVYATSNYQPIFESTPPDGDGVLALSPDGGLLATGGSGGTVYLWKVIYRP